MSIQAIFKYYASHRPYFLAFVRTLEIAKYQKCPTLKGKILDFGCGDGFFLETLTKFAPKLISGKVTGLDLKTLTNSPVYSLRATYSGQKIPFADQFFNQILSNCVLEHIPNLELTLKELHRVLKPGGRLVVTVMANRWHDYCLLPSFFWDKVQVHFNLFSFDTWQKLFRQSGFKVATSSGYLNRSQTRFVELGHFLSFPYLLSRRLFGSWNRFNFLYRGLTASKLANTLLKAKVTHSEASAFYFELQKQ
jgi:SAM-dependent methyltransferase